jgi:hypothetical protein
VLTDERLDYLAERFHSLTIRPLTKATFAQYVADPDRYDRAAQVLLAGHALARVGNRGPFKVVPLGTIH